MEYSQWNIRSRASDSNQVNRAVHGESSASVFTLASVDRRLPMSGETENEAVVATETKLQRSDTLLTNVSSCRDDDGGDDDDDIAQRVANATAHVDSVRLSFNTTPVIPPIAHLPTATAVPPTEHTPTAATLPFEDAMHSLPLLPSIETTNVQEPCEYTNQSEH